jgi:hypothetical protein
MSAARARPLQSAAVSAQEDFRAGVGGWTLWAIALAAGLAGAAMSSGTLLTGVPDAAEWGIAAVAVAGLAAAAGITRGVLGFGLLPLAVLLAFDYRYGMAAAVTGGPLIAVALAVAICALAAARPPWARRAFVPVIVIVHLAAAARVQGQVGPQGDEPHYLMVADSILRDGDLALGADYVAGRYRAFHPRDLDPHYRVRGKDGAIYSLHAVGLSILVLPAYAAFGYAGASFFMALLGIAAAWQVRALARDALGDEGLADAAGWIAGLSPPLVHFAGLVFTEVPAALGLAVALRFALAPGSPRRALAGGAVLAALPWLNVRYAILAAIVLAVAIARRRSLREGIPWAAPGAASALGLALFHHALYGFFDPRRVYGRRPEFSMDVVPTGLPGLLFDQEFGLLVYAPVFALAAPGLVRLARRRPLVAAASGAMIAAVLAVASAWPMWRGGFNPPARFLLPVVPVLAIGAAAWLGRGLTFPAALLIGWGAWAGLAGTIDRDLVHRDRDGTAPLFRARSGAVEWTTLLPGYVLGESARDRVPLTATWALALALAAAAKRAPDPWQVAFGSVGLVAACAAAGWAGSAVSQGRDAVRVIGRTAVELPYGPIVRGEARWTPDVLDWGPAYEPHRHPAGVAIGARLPLAPGRYDIEVDADVLPSALPPPALKVIEAGREPTSVDLGETPGGRFGAAFEVRERPDVTLILLGGRPLIINEIRLVRSTLSAGGGPIP